MKLLNRVPFLLLIVALSSCTSTPQSEPKLQSNNNQTPSTTVADINTPAFSGDHSQLQILIPECLNAVRGQSVTLSALENFGYKRTALNPNAYQRITSRNFVGLTGSFDQFAYRPGKNCSIGIGMSQRSRYTAFQQSAYSILEQNGFTSIETNGVLGGKRVTLQSDDGTMVAETILSRSGTVIGSLEIRKK